MIHADDLELPGDAVLAGEADLLLVNVTIPVVQVEATDEGEDEGDEAAAPAAE